MSIVFSEDRGAVRHVVLNRPEKRNAMNQELLRALGDELRAAAADEAVHCVVLRGEGGFEAHVITFGAALQALIVPDASGHCDDVVLGYDCNLACTYCTITDEMRRRALPAEKIAREIDRAAAHGYRDVAFTGGEPTTRSDLPALVKHARRRGFFNGVLDQGLVHDRQHLFRASLGGRKKARAKTRDRKNRLAYCAHRHFLDVKVLVMVP